MIDYLLLFTDENTAKADSVVGAYYVDSWQGDCVIPNLQVWHPSQDTNVDGSITHTYLPGFAMIISKSVRDSTLDSHSATQLVTDRDAANRGEPFILQTIYTTAQLNDYDLQPTFAGSNYPFGAVNV